MRKLGLTARVAGLCLAALLAACSKPSPGPAGAGSPEAPGPSIPAAEASAAAPSKSAGPTLPAIYDERSTRVATKTGHHFSVMLPASIGTPMKWRIEPAPNTAVLVLSGESYSDAPPAGCEACTGYPGTRRFDFEARAAGRQTLHFAYAPLSGPKAPPEKEVTLEVVVE